MITLSKIEQDLTAAIKGKNSLEAETLRGLKNRIMNEKIARMPAAGGAASGGQDLQEADLVALVKSEVKRRKEAALAFRQGGRPELEEKELLEAAVLERYLPAQMTQEQAAELVDRVLAENNFTAKDFGAAMGKLKALAGQSADGAVLASILKEKLK